MPHFKHPILLRNKILSCAISKILFKLKKSKTINSRLIRLIKNFIKMSKILVRHFLQLCLLQKNYLFKMKSNLQITKFYKARGRLKIIKTM